MLVPVPGAPFLLLDAGANVEVRPEHLVQFAHMGAAFMEAAMGVSRAARGAAVQRHGGVEGHRDRRRRARGAVRLGVAAELRRQRRGLRDRHRRGRRDRRRRLHRQRRAEGDGGLVGRAARRGARGRDLVAALEARRPAAAARAARAARRARPAGAGRRGAARPAPARRSSRTARSGGGDSRARSRSPPAACARTSPGARTRRSPARARCGGPGGVRRVASVPDQS